MAAFNPSPGGVPSPNMSDQTGASRGAIPNRAFESLFEGAGALVKGAVTAYDDLNKYNITEEVKAGWGKVNEPFDTDNLPKDLTDSAATLQSLQTARDQGKLSDVYYTGQLAALSKKLRTQYPQYDQYIDQTFQRITGIKPANAFRNALLSDLEAQQATAADAEKAKDQWIKDNTNFILRSNPYFFEDPDSYDFDQVKREAYRVRGEDAMLEAQMNDFDFQLKAGQVTDEQTIEVASNELAHIVDIRINSTANGLSVKGTDLLDQMTKISEDGYTPAEAQEVGTFLTQLEAQVTAEVNAALRKGREGDPDHRSFEDMLDPTKTQQLKDRALQPLKDLIKFAYDENWGMFAYALNQIKLEKDTEVSRIFKSSPEARYANALKEINGELANMYITEPGIKDTILAQSTPELMAGVAMGTRSWGDVVKQMADSRKDAATKAGGINAMIDLGQGTILNGVASDTEFANVVKSMYATDEDGKAIFGYIAKEEYPALYNRMFNKAVTQKILESDDQDLIELYYESAQEAFRGNPQFKAAAGNLQADASFTKDLLAPIQFSFNPDFNRFIVSRSGEPASFAGMDYQESENFLETKMMMANKTIETLNAGLDSLAPILDGIGLSPEEKTAEVKRLITNLNIDLEGGDFGLFGELAKSMGNTTDEQGAAKQFVGDINTLGGVMSEFGGMKVNTKNPDGTSRARANDVTILNDTPYELTEDSFNPEAIKNHLENTVGSLKTQDMLDAETPLKVAEAFLGKKEANPEHAKAISAFIKNNAGIDINPAKTAWCAAFLNAVLGASGTKGTGKLNAKSFLTWGVSVSDSPKKGDVVVMNSSEPNAQAWQGHTGIYMGTNPDGTIKVLAGNQGDKVSIIDWDPKWVIDFRRAQ